MTLRQFLDALGGQRREVEIALAMYAGLLFDVHWNDHAGQLAKIRKAVGL